MADPDLELERGGGGGGGCFTCPAGFFPSFPKIKGALEPLGPSSTVYPPLLLDGFTENTGMHKLHNFSFSFLFTRKNENINNLSARVTTHTFVSLKLLNE